MRCDRLRLSCRALERRHISDRTVVWVRDLVVGDIERAHGIPPIVPSSTWHKDPAFSSAQKPFGSFEGRDLRAFPAKAGIHFCRGHRLFAGEAGWIGILHGLNDPSSECLTSVPLARSDEILI